MLKFIAVALVAYYAHYFYTTHTHKDVLVFIKSKNIDLKALKMLSHTYSVFKVKHLEKADSQWDHAVLAKGFLTDESRDAYVSTLNYLKFVETTQKVNIHAGMASLPIVLNIGMKVSKIVGSVFGYLAVRPLKPNVPPFVNCSTVEIRKGESLFTLSLMKRTGNKTAEFEFGWKFMMMKLLPVLNTNFVYMGYPEATNWDVFNIAQYVDKDTFCEYMLSELVIKHGQDYLNAFAEHVGYTGGELN